MEAVHAKTSERTALAYGNLWKTEVCRPGSSSVMESRLGMQEALHVISRTEKKGKRQGFAQHLYLSFPDGLGGESPSECPVRGRRHRNGLPSGL